MAVAISYIFFLFASIYLIRFNIQVRICVRVSSRFLSMPSLLFPFLCCSQSCVCAVLPPLTPLSLSLSIRFRCNCRPLSI
ncbi:hypothetical protein DAPPUDRAFT_305294 [Daphnia pulex]|uniref:Uncharacterized protein n=1 Tax=Daphnia pulex TaxID=6669 RepID=E9I3Q9_DAPPU|nr:hypothetical protein DAPPUDRAFT_305294 [Daphnia pulex]|eukprot:EFX61371.1 hypothetical protein DAPPUDRAFT_305294 [Daphnia pulex]